MSQLKQDVLEFVKQIPEKRVVNFGEIARIVGSDARTVGFILTGLTDTEMNQVPWYRVVAKNGYISSLKLGAKGMMQKEILIDEAYSITGDKVDVTKHMWSAFDEKEKESLF